MTSYSIKNSQALTATEIRTILKAWDVTAWNSMDTLQFREAFSQSEFHLLSDSSGLLCIARINFDLSIRIAATIYPFPEFVGLAAISKNKGYGKTLIGYIIAELKRRNMECIGFCRSEVRAFYEKCAVPLLYDKAQYLLEKEQQGWNNVTDDDDIIILNVFEAHHNILRRLSPIHPGYLIFKP